MALTCRAKEMWERRAMRPRGGPSESHRFNPRHAQPKSHKHGAEREATYQYKFAAWFVSWAVRWASLQLPPTPADAVAGAHLA
eukprot:3310118-Prymnesium_polylepis.1